MSAPAAATLAIVFAHANGFPAGTYRQLFEPWRAAGFAVHAIAKLGHDPRFPVTSNWPHLRDQMLRFQEEQVGAPAWLVGHSLGGYLCLMAASQRPELVRGVVLLDSPVVAGWKAGVVQLAKRAGLAERFGPGRLSKRRREHWDSFDAARAHFASKQIFARWAPGVLDDYIACGTEPHGAQQRLAFDRRIETAIYNAIPHQLARSLRTRPLQCPLAFIGGRDSQEIRQAGLAATQRLAQGRVRLIEGSHLFPLERPAETAAEVLNAIAAMTLAAQALPASGAGTPRL